MPQRSLKIRVPLAVLMALPSIAQVETPPQPVVFRVDVDSRTTKAINFHHRQGSTVVALEGRSLAPQAKGEVKVNSKTGATQIDATVVKLQPATIAGDGSLTHVLWAITPEGRAENLGEMMLDGDGGRLQAATGLQTFGLILTAEPYYAVTQPSDYVIMEGVVKLGTTGTIMPVEVKFELIERGGYLQPRRRWRPLCGRHVEEGGRGYVQRGGDAEVGTRIAAAEEERELAAMKQRELEAEEKARMKAELSRQLNMVLDTRATARGLIVNMSDVPFDFGQHSLRPIAREKLARIAGIDLKVEVEGHTDSVGSDDFNMRLSEKRASALRTYLVEQRINSGSIVARGLGKWNPVADNSTAAGRQANRRVELVVNGPQITSGPEGVGDNHDWVSKACTRAERSASPFTLFAPSATSWNGPLVSDVSSGSSF